MHKYLTNDGSNYDAPIIVHITFVSSVVFHKWNDGTFLKLMGYKPMGQHFVEEKLEPIKENQRPVEEVFGTNERIIVINSAEDKTKRVRQS